MKHVHESQILLGWASQHLILDLGKKILATVKATVPPIDLSDVG